MPDGRADKDDAIVEICCRNREILDTPSAGAHTSSRESRVASSSVTFALPSIAPPFLRDPSWKPRPPMSDQIGRNR